VDESGMDVIVGSKGRTGKADVVIAVVPGLQVQQESQVVTLAQLLSNRKNRVEKLKGPQYTVRYMPSGRVQVGTLFGSGCHGLLFQPRGTVPESNNYIIELTRLPDDLDNLMAAQCKRVPMLHFYTPMSGIDVDN